MVAVTEVCLTATTSAEEAAGEAGCGSRDELPKRSCSRLGEGRYAGLWFDCRSRLFCPPFVLLAPSCGVQFSFGKWDPPRARHRAGPTGHPYRQYGHIDDTGGLLLDREDSHNSNNWRVFDWEVE